MDRLEEHQTVIVLILSGGPRFDPALTDLFGNFPAFDFETSCFAYMVRHPKVCMKMGEADQIIFPTTSERAD